MNFDEYQVKAIATAIYPEKYTIVYPTLGLVGEAGEVAEKVKKIIRDYNAEYHSGFKKEIAKELGDVLWYVANLADDLDFSLSEIAQMNLDKLTSRKERGTLKGSGDDR